MKISLIPAPKILSLREGTATPDAAATETLNASLAPEAYHLAIQNHGVQITAGSDQGFLWARRTLEQLRFQFPSALPCMEIADEPAFGWRSFHIDCAWHFFSMDELKKMIHAASCFKFNRFHWHFADDQGWRLESRVFPLLHEIGSNRKGDHFGNYSSNTPECAYYTQEEARELIRFAREEGIEIVPEIEIPGHFTALLAAYPSLSCTGAVQEVATSAGIYPDILCAGKDEVFIFMEKLLSEMVDLFPGEYFHLGGDEAPKTRWKACPRCQARMAQEYLSDLQQLQGWMLNRMARILTEKGKKVIVWNEAAYGGNLDPSLTIQLWTADRGNHLVRHMEKGGKVLLSPMMNAYCDYPHAFIPARNIYQLDTAPEGLPPWQVLGTECLVWTEYIRSPRELEQKAWPRFAASAEVGWSGQTRPGYEDFEDRLKTVFPMLEKAGIQAAPWPWSPSMEEGLQELMAFRSNISPELSASYHQAQEEI